MGRAISKLVLLNDKTRVGEIEIGHTEVDLSPYDLVVDESMEYPDHTEFTIGFHSKGLIVRRMWNPSCDITYKE